MTLFLLSIAVPSVLTAVLLAWPVEKAPPRVPMRDLRAAALGVSDPRDDEHAAIIEAAAMVVREATAPTCIAREARRARGIEP